MKGDLKIDQFHLLVLKKKNCPLMFFCGVAPARKLSTDVHDNGGNDCKEKTKFSMSVFEHQDGLFGVRAAGPDLILKSKTRRRGGRTGNTHRGSAAHGKRIKIPHARARTPKGWALWGKCEGSSEGGRGCVRVSTLLT